MSAKASHGNTGCNFETKSYSVFDASETDRCSLDTHEPRQPNSKQGWKLSSAIYWGQA